MPEPKKTYSELLELLQASCPHAAAVLQKAHEAREALLSVYLSGARLKGFEELVEHIDAVRGEYEKHPKLKKVSFLLARAKSEFGIGLESALSGLHTVAHDAMRAVMEIEFLLRDFTLDHSRLDEWAHATLATLKKRFQPGQLRERFAKHVGKKTEDLPEAMDYKGHSVFLHVGNRPPVFGLSGEMDEFGFSVDSCFWEMFEHARRLVIAINNLADSFDTDISEKYDDDKLERLKNAWARTQEMQRFWEVLTDYERNAPKGSSPDN